MFSKNLSHHTSGFSKVNKFLFLKALTLGLAFPSH